MTRRSIERFRPIGIPNARFFSNDDLENIITAAGGLPEGEITHSRPADDGSHTIPVEVPRRIALAERLESAARLWGTLAPYQVEPTPKQRADAFGKIERVAADLLTTLGLPAEPEEGADIEDLSDDIPQAIGFRGLRERAELDAERLRGETGSSLLRRSVVGVYRLHAWAGDAKEQASAEPVTDRRERRARDDALDELYRSLGEIWKEVFGRPISTSMTAVPDSGNEHRTNYLSTGPLIRYLRACLWPILKNENLTDHAIRDRARVVFKNKGKSARQKI